MQITTCEELYEALRTNLATPITGTSARKRLEAVLQAEHETMQSYNMRFRHKLNELRCAMQTKHSKPACRRIALKEEELNAIEIYVKNLRENIGRLVIPSNQKRFLEVQQKTNDVEL